MQVAIAGAHGQIALRLSRLLAATPHEVVGLIRDPAQAQDLQAAGARPVVCDLEHEPLSAVSTAVAEADVVVFAAGAGAGSSAERKLSMDRDGAIKLLRASEPRRARYLMVSAVGAEDPPVGDDVFSVYLQAKAQADRAVTASDRDWTIVRPGQLLDDPGTGLVRLVTEPLRAPITRDDVAAVLAALLARAEGPRAIIYAAGGDTPVSTALNAIDPA